MKYSIKTLEIELLKKEGVLRSITDMECEFMSNHPMREVIESEIKDLKSAIEVLEWSQKYQ